MSKLLEVHYYDHKLLDRYSSLKEWDDKNLCLEIPFKKSMNEIIKFGKKNLKKKRLMKFLKICDLLLNDKNSNIDMTNKIRVEDILPRVWRFYRLFETEQKMVFMEQFIDITNGTCPQGRGTRLFQLYHFLIEASKDKKLRDDDFEEILKKIKIKVNRL